MQIDREKGLDFEYQIQSFFEERGYAVFDTPATNDYGADLILHFNGKVIAIQCKCHDKPIGIGAVQEIIGAVPYYKADKGLVISNQPFTKQARVLAAANHVLLIGGRDLDIFLRDPNGDAAMLAEMIHDKTNPSRVKPENKSIFGRLFCRAAG